ncbi:unnamed protein product [Callosobruchus maculatus]|uniref:Uncharacterized protein n=1 Tax=Callosobruchus maculatus TaxID=64391 RepID=A0A653CGZ2_CALMS|nr:unnamed protein product [Callosobruchus maculatus]
MPQVQLCFVIPSTLQSRNLYVLCSQFARRKVVDCRAPLNNCINCLPKNYCIKYLNKKWRTKITKGGQITRKREINSKMCMAVNFFNFALNL